MNERMAGIFMPKDNGNLHKRKLLKRFLSLILATVILSAAAGIGPSFTGTVGPIPVYAAKNKKKVVVLDPGHGGREKVACHFGMQEKVLNLKIAKYCEAELKKYAGVTVIMTRRTDRSMNAGGYSEDLLARCRIAKQHNADLFVCLHNNAYGPGESAATHGVRVYYQNSSFYAGVGAESKNLALKILRRIAGCGVANGGVRTKNSANRRRRDKRGNKGDYYAVLYHNKTYRIPAVIVEHAFMSNAGDAALLKKEAFLKRLGEADAAAIAEHLGLKKSGKYPTGWQKGSAGKYYYDNNGYKLTGWQTIGGKKYYFSVKDGRMLTGTRRIGSKTYTFSKKGVLIK